MAESVLGAMTDEAAQGNWTLKRGDKELFTQPRIGVLGRSCSTTGITTADSCRSTCGCWMFRSRLCTDRRRTKTRSLREDGTRLERNSPGGSCFELDSARRPIIPSRLGARPA